jgi:DNA-binding transcriptional regulator YiaG
MIELPPPSGPWTAEQVAAARAALGLTQAELADALELGEGLKAKNGKDTVRNWERGARPITGPARVAIRFMLARAGKGRSPKGKPTPAIIEPTLKGPRQ